VEVISIPPELNVVAEYPIAVLRGAPQAGFGTRIRRAGAVVRRAGGAGATWVPVRSRAWDAVQLASIGLLVSFLLLPVASLGLTLSWDELVTGLRHPLLLPAVRLSLTHSASSLTLVVVLGLLGRLVDCAARGTSLAPDRVRHPAARGHPSRGRRGGLLLAFGRRGLFGAFLERHGIALPFTTPAVCSPRPSFPRPSSSRPPSQPSAGSTRT